MTSYLFTLFSCAALLYQADSIPRWSWGKFADLESVTPKKEHLKDCLHGQCLKAWKCPENETALEIPTTCSKRSDGPWICCIRQSENEREKLIENSEVTTSNQIEHLVPVTNKPNTINRSLTPDWISVVVNDQQSQDINSSSQGTVVDYQEKANIVNWAMFPKNLHQKDSRNDVAVNNGYKPYVWSKGSTSKPGYRVTEDKWLNPVSAELRNKYPSGTEHNVAAENSWNYNHNHHGNKKTTKNWIVNPTSPSRWSSTKSHWNRDYASSKSTNKWESRSTLSSRERPLSETRDKVVNSRSTTHTPVQHTWTKSSKPVYVRDSHLYGSTTSKPLTKTTHSWQSTASSDKKNKFRSTGNTLVEPTRDSWSWGSSKSVHKWDSNLYGSTTSNPIVKTTRSWRSTAGSDKGLKTNSTVNNRAKPTRDSWNRDSSSNTEKKSTKVLQNTSTTRKPIPKVSTKASSRLTTLRSGSTKHTDSTRKSSFENIEKSENFPRKPSSVTRSTTKKYTRTTPLPDVNSQRCGIRITSREAPRRGKRHLGSDEVVAFTDGRIAGRDRSPFQRIVGGQEAEPFSWPWVAALYRVSESGGNRFLSAGSLINRNFVLTAAHVFTPDDLRSASFVVMLGTHTAREAFAEYVVMYVLRHPNYQQRYYYNDIALLRLEQPVDFNEYVMPVCLPSPSLPLVRDEDLEGKRVTVMGWGDESYGGKTSRVLQEASFPILPRKSCNASYFQVASNRFPRGITSNMLCAGDPNGGKDACQGDSGGPLTTYENGRHTQVGIVSFGYKCGDKEYPGVYTKVAPYLSWIAENARCDDYPSDYSYYSR